MGRVEREERRNMGRNRTGEERKGRGEGGKKDWEREDRSEGEGEYSIRYNNNNIIIYNIIIYNI